MNQNKNKWISKFRYKKYKIMDSKIYKNNLIFWNINVKI